MNEYVAAPGGTLTDKDAERIGKYLERKAPDGATAERFVELARPASSPIHGDLEWDDTVAAREHRLQQARTVLNHLQIVLERPNGDRVVTRAYHAIRFEGQRERTYMPQSIVWSDVDMRMEVLARARRELELWTDRYEQYGELAGEVQSIRELLTV